MHVSLVQGRCSVDAGVGVVVGVRVGGELCR